MNNYETLADNVALDKVVDALKERGVEAIVLESKNDALEKIKSLIPAGVSVMNGTSATLQEIGYIDYLKSEKHSWNNLHKGILDEKDPAKQLYLENNLFFLTII